MSEQLQPGIHPDADSLNALMEGALPEHERQQCLAHLAECARCREIVFLAQEPQPAAPEPVRARRWWFAPLPVFAAAAVACVATVTVWLYTSRPKPPAAALVARVEQAPAPQPQPIQPQPVRPQPAQPKPAAPAAPLTALQRPPERTFAKKSPLIAAPAPLAAPAVQPVPPRDSLGGAVGTTSPPQPPAAEPRIAANAIANAPAAAAPAPSAISITVTDASGVVIPAAEIKLRQVDGAYTSDARADSDGKYDAAGLAPGHYELQVSARGFVQSSRQIDLKPGEVAAVAPSLEVGAAAQTVTVTQAISTRKALSAPSESRLAAIAEGALKARKPAPLTTATSGKIILQVDSAGTVLVSKNSGKSWNLVKPVWSGKAERIELAAPPQPSGATFQLTTDTGAVWLSRDGTHWTIQKN